MRETLPTARWEKLAAPLQLMADIDLSILGSAADRCAENELQAGNNVSWALDLPDVGLRTFRWSARV